MVKIIFKLHFLQAKYAFKGLLLNCPDIMFNVIEDPLIFKDDFKSLAKKFNVYAVNLWSDYNFIYNTTDIQRKCEKNNWSHIVTSLYRYYLHCAKTLEMLKKLHNVLI